jgi:predicted nuclease of predicted toxin-antitoxin system
MASLYSNENFPKRVVEELRRLGHDVLTSYEAGRANQKIPDDQVLEYAISQNRAVLTLNRVDFIRLHQQAPGAHAGIIVCTRDDANPQAFAERIHAALSIHSDPAGQLIRIVRPANQGNACESE